MVIGLSSYRFVNNDISFNISQIGRAMEALQGKADLLCFGESFLQGFDSLQWDHQQDMDVAVTQDSAVIRELCALTCRYGVDLLLGYIEKEDSALYSSCMLIENGRILHNYRRISTGWKEISRTDGHYCEGSESTDFVYRGRTFRIALCGDLWEFPEAFRTEGILLWPVYVNFDLEEWKENEQDYADQAQLVASQTMLINSISEDPEAVGGAFFFENGRITARLPYNTEDTLLLEID